MGDQVECLLEVHKPHIVVACVKIILSHNHSTMCISWARLINTVCLNLFKQYLLLTDSNLTECNPATVLLSFVCCINMSQYLTYYFQCVMQRVSSVSVASIHLNSCFVQ